MTKKLVVIAAGGTGGHVFPGLAVAEELLDRGFSVEWTGTELGLESRLVPVAGVKLHFFPVSGIRGKGTLQLLVAPFKVLQSVFCAVRLLRKLGPSVVLGFGGFVSGPIGLAAYLTRIPLIIHEQNAIAGTTNKLLSRISDRVLTAFPVKLRNRNVVGNPIRKKLEELSFIKQKQERGENEKINVLIVGGSRGSKALNTRLPSTLKNAGVEEKIDIWHQSGSGRIKEAEQAYQHQKLAAKITPFIEDMDEAMLWADFMICRAGALTVSEISLVGLPAILVPYPYAIDDHQTANAKYLESRGAALIVQESEFDGGKLEEAIISMTSSREYLNQMATLSREASARDAAKKFADICEELAL